MSPTHQIREQLLREILNGTFKPGDLLPSERALCEMFEVSRVSVREAIAGLEAMGVVHVQHGRGCFVAEGVGDKFAGPFGKWLMQHRDQMIELLKVRGALDGLAAFEMAQLGDADALAELESVHGRYQEMVDADGPLDLSDLVAVDVSFHATIAVESKSSLLAGLLTELNSHIADSRRLTFLGEGQPQRSCREHEAIVDAIRRKDPEAAKFTATQHVLSVQHWLEKNP
ncbi:MAG TPA: FadR/GntR family transcriptional regulator [Jatrophihabitans sp.]|nr:FadR/GntR family transcriptional regulator [Jatrophihabitans sp.]